MEPPRLAALTVGSGDSPLPEGADDVVKDADRDDPEDKSEVVVSPLPISMRMLGALLSDGDDGLSCCARALHVLYALLAAFMLFAVPHGFASNTDMEQPNSLLYITGALQGLSVALPATCIGSVAQALRCGGSLQRLGAGVVLVSAGDARQLARWMWAIRIFGMGLLAFGLVCVHWGIGVARFGPDFRVCMTMAGLAWCLLAPGLFTWWCAMYLASCLTRGTIGKVIHAIRTTSPLCDHWHADVAQPALDLRETMQLLSDGWARGLASLCGTSFALGMWAFTLAINNSVTFAFDASLNLSPGTIRNYFIGSITVFVSAPILICVDIASTSSQCVLLMDQLNEARARHGPACSEKIRWLELTLRQVNAGQGLGFKLGDGPQGVVLDIMRLKGIALGLFGALSTAITYMLSLTDEVTAAEVAANLVNRTADAASSGSGDGECCTLQCKLELSAFDAVFNCTTGDDSAATTLLFWLLYNLGLMGDAGHIDGTGTVATLELGIMGSLGAGFACMVWVAKRRLDAEDAASPTSPHGTARHYVAVCSIEDSAEEADQLLDASTAAQASDTVVP